MAVIGIIGLLTYFIIRLVKQQKEGKQLHSADTPQNYKEFIKDIIMVFRQKQARYITASAIIDSLASSPIYVYLPFLLVSYGVNSVLLSIGMGAFFVGSLLGKYFLGRVIGILGNRKVFIISEFCMALSLFFIAHTAQYFLILLFAVFLGVFTKGTSPVVQTLFSELADKEHYHKVFAVSELVIGLAAVIIIIIMGSLADRAGIKTIFYLSALLAVCATLPISLFSKEKSNK